MNGGAIILTNWSYSKIMFYQIHNKVYSIVTKSAVPLNVDM